MPTTNYARGRAFEYRIKKHLEALGYRVIRSAASHSPIDLLAGGSGGGSIPPIVAVQCKTGKARTTLAGRKEFFEWADKFGAEAFIASRPQGKRTILWGRVNEKGEYYASDGPT
jgi:Holliday junction resolvase